MRNLVAILLVGFQGLALAAPSPDGNPAALRLVDVLLADDLESPAACPAVGDGAPNATDLDDPTRVELGLFVQALDGIDPSTNSFHAEGIATIVWCDPREAFEPAAGKPDVKNIGGVLVQDTLREIWWPGLLVPTRLGSPSLANEQLLIYRDGTVSYRGKLNLRIIADFDFSQFPFDRQVLRIPVHGQLHRAENLVIVPAKRRTGFAPDFRIPEWTFLGHRVVVEPVPNAEGDELSQLVFEIEIGRQVGFYLWSIMLPLLTIVGVAWSTFWMRDAAGQRHRQSATAILTIVAFQFVATANLPRVSYLTLMGQVNLWSIVVIAATLWTNNVALRAYRQDQELGVRIDRRGRWVLPLLYVLGVLLISAIKLSR